MQRSYAEGERRTCAVQTLGAGKRPICGPADRRHLGAEARRAQG